MSVMADLLLRHGKLTEIDPQGQRDLVAEVALLRAAGHAIALEETVQDGKVTSVAAHHYRTCVKCTAGK